MIKEQSDAVHKMEACVQDIRIWMRENKLKLNEDKTELVIIAPSRQYHKVKFNSITIGDVEVLGSPTAKNLGAIFDNSMTLNPHITSLIKSCNHQLRSIGRARQYLTYEATEKVIHAFISSQLDNGNSLLYGLPDCLIGKLQRVQNTAARILTRTRKFEHITPVLKSLHWLEVSKRIEFKLLTLTHKCLHGKAPHYLEELVTLHTSSREGLRSSNKDLLVVPKSKHKTMGDRAFAIAAPTLWNQLPFSIRKIDCFDTFKIKLKSHLLVGAEDTASQ